MENIIPRIKAELQKLNVTPEQWKSHLKKVEILNQSNHEPHIFPGYSDNGNYYIGFRYARGRSRLTIRFFKTKVTITALEQRGEYLANINEPGTIKNLKYYLSDWFEGK